MPALGDEPVRAVFIQAPWVESVGEQVEVLGTVEHGPAAGRIVAVRQGRRLATSFHPELTGISGAPAVPGHGDRVGPWHRGADAGRSNGGCMSGHSGRATTKHKKAVIDARRGKLFAKLIKNIEVAALHRRRDPDGNPTLYDAIQKARKNSVPLDNIERAVKRGSGAEAGGANWETIMYEG